LHDVDGDVMKVGFIGLGTMGRPMAANIAKAGFALTVFNRSPMAQALLPQGKVVVAPTLAALADGIDVLVTMVTDDAALEDVFYTKGLLQLLAPGVVHLSCSTISVAMARRLQEAHGQRAQALVSAPVVGRADKAAERMLVALVSGPEREKALVAPLLESTSRRTFDFGLDPAAAVAAKLANNFMIGASIDMLGQAFGLTDAYGVERQAFLEFVTSSLFAAPIFKIYGDLILGETFVPAGSPLPIGIKDMRLAIAAAREGQRGLPFAYIVQAHLEAAIDAGLQDHDWAVLGAPAMQWPAAPGAATSNRRS
jgi:3-hydroxyisobutyrate dehydrogenase-like beta-hydroxyacid dehydrogenase